MAEKKTELVVSLVGMVEAIIVALVKFIREAGGDVGECVCHLASAKGEGTIRKVAELIVAEARVVQQAAAEIKHIIDLDADPYVPEKWTVVEHQKGGQLEWDQKKIALWLSENQKNGKAIKGHLLREELKGKPVFNANLLDYLLAHPELIPEEWKGKTVFFWGTFYRDDDGGLCVRYLYWCGGRWFWSVHWLDFGWSSGRPAAVPANS